VPYEAEAVSSGQTRLLLTAAIPAGKDTIDAGYEIDLISSEFDFMNLMTYDLHGAWDDYTGHNAPLYPRADEEGAERYLNVEWAANYWVDNGAPKNKLVIGMPTYGRSFTLADPGNNGMGAPASGAGPPGTYTREEGFYAYYEVCDALLSNNAEYEWHDEHMVPWAYNDEVWCGYDDTTSLLNKIHWMVDNQFGGWMAWCFDLDDFNGQFCGGTDYPLFKTMNYGLLGYVPTGEPPTDPPPATTVEGQTTTTTTMAPGGFTCDGQPNGNYADPEDCTKYYTCSNGNTFHYTCSDGTYWDPDIGVCNWPYNLSEDRQEECGL